MPVPPTELSPNTVRYVSCISDTVFSREKTQASLSFERAITKSLNATYTHKNNHHCGHRAYVTVERQHKRFHRQNAND
jgi:hypothetical protein